MEWFQDCWLLGYDEETVGNVLVIDSMFVGSGGTPHTPPLGGNCFPQTPSMNCGVYLSDVRQCDFG
ncbi:MAG: hypothetical protein PVF83_03505 [Anaerolineales bacterium]|jgi:hypothetical protein